MSHTKTIAKTLDTSDVLCDYKKEFYLLKNTIYMDGNSLGLLSKRAEKSLLEVIRAYKLLGIEGWIQGENPFFYLAERLGKMFSQVVGALPEEVVIANSTSVNLHQLLATFYRPKGKRVKILIDEFIFPTDRYVIVSQLLLHGRNPKKELVVVKSINGKTIDTTDVIAAMTDEVAIIVLPTVLYQSGQLLDMQHLTQAAHKKGIFIGFDACHSAGVVPHAFHDDNVDFAVFCTYKYLNGGPGASAGLFVHKNHLGKVPGLAGWFGSAKDRQFDMDSNIQIADSAGAYQIGTPHILSMAPLLGSLELINQVGIQAIRKKSLALTEYMMELVDKEVSKYGFSLVTPRLADARGGHIALTHPEATSICKALKENGVIPDFRPPTIIRFAPSPLYTSFEDVYKTIRILKNIMIRNLYKNFVNKREVVA